MGKKFLIDTNVLIDFQLKVLPDQAYGFLGDIMNDDFIVSFISYIEFLGYARATQAMKDFIHLARVVEVDRSIIEETILLRKTKRIKLPDAIIAATAIAREFTLISRNVEDFKNIAGLQIINPYQL